VVVFLNRSFGLIPACFFFYNKSKGSVRETIKRDRHEDKEAKKARKAEVKAERAVRPSCLSFLILRILTNKSFIDLGWDGMAL
jgi:hypothetical protein